jgi:hypothetical protein
MTLDEAQQLAKLVDASTEWMPIAIGRFIVPEELQVAMDRGFLHKVPWMVAIAKIGDVRTRRKLTCFQDWEDLNSRQIIPETRQVPDGMLF